MQLKKHCEKKLKDAEIKIKKVVDNKNRTNSMKHKSQIENLISTFSKEV